MMHMTLSPNIEREAIQEIRDRRRDESAPAFLFQLVKATAWLLVHGTLHRVLAAIVGNIIRHVKSRNDRIANHLKWFPAATEELRAAVEEAGLPASEDLREALDGLVSQIDETTPRLLRLIEILDASSDLGRAVHRSMRLLLEVKKCAIDMKRAGMLVEQPDEITLRIEAAQAQMIATHGRILTGTSERDPFLLSLARGAAVRRASNTATVKPASAQQVLEKA